MKESFIAELGLHLNSRFLTDRMFYLAVFAAPVSLLVLTVVLPDWYHNVAISLALSFSFIIWQPLIEELLFRGVIQGQLIKYHWAQKGFYGLTLANSFTSLLFVALHFFNHSFFWALSVLLPSLVFGYFRDRHQHIYSCLLLHAIYNGAYFSAVVLLN